MTTENKTSTLSAVNEQVKSDLQGKSLKAAVQQQPKMEPLKAAAADIRSKRTAFEQEVADHTQKRNLLNSQDRAVQSPSIEATIRSLQEKTSGL